MSSKEKTVFKSQCKYQNVNVNIKCQCKHKMKERLFCWKHWISLWSTKVQPINSVKDQSGFPSLLKIKNKLKLFQKFVLYHVDSMTTMRTSAQKDLKDG